jgi:hypothetical protein
MEPTSFVKYVLTGASRPVTTQKVGEEGGTGPVTTLAVGEEAGNTVR